VEGFHRIFGATIFFGTDEQRKSPYVDGRFHYFDRVKVWFNADEDTRWVAKDIPNAIELSENFWYELRQHPIPINLYAVQTFSNFPALLDFYTWLAWRCWTAYKPVAIPLFGEGGLLEQLGISGQTAMFEFRRQLKRWLAAIKRPDIWPDCPAEISSNGQYLIISPHKAIAPRKA
jgi:hypothetical protein